MMVDTSNRSLTFSASLTGMINFELISLSGEGKIERSQGLTEGKYQIHHIPTGFDFHLLGSILITGYPNATASIDNAPLLSARAP